MAPADRDALLYGIIVESYGHTNDVGLTCNNCTSTFQYSFNIPTSMEITPYTGEEYLLTKRVELKFPEYDWILQLKQPTVKDELMTLALNRGDSKLTSASQYTIVASLDAPATSDGGKDKIIRNMFTNPYEIYGAISKKPARVRKTIFKAWSDAFGKYGIKVACETTCPSCGASVSNIMNPVNHLFFLVA